MTMPAPQPGPAPARVESSSSAETCPVCGSNALADIRCKTICQRCRTIVRSCADL